MIKAVFSYFYRQTLVMDPKRHVLNFSFVNAQKGLRKKWIWMERGKATNEEMEKGEKI